MRQKFIALVLGIALFQTALGLAFERIWLDAKINDKPARLVFDSGASVSALSPDAVENFGLKFVPRSTNNFPPEVRAGHTEICTLKLEGAVT